MIMMNSLSIILLVLVIAIMNISGKTTGIASASSVSLVNVNVNVNSTYNNSNNNSKNKNHYIKKGSGYNGEKLRPICDVIHDFGAIGDNKTEDTHAVQQAIQSCERIILPSGHVFLLRPIEILSNRILQIDGDIAAWRNIETWPNSTNKVCAESGYTDAVPITVPQKEALIWGITPLVNVTIEGHGLVDGQGQRWWKKRGTEMEEYGEYWHNCRPQLMYLGQGNVTDFGSVSNIHISGVTFKDAPFWTLTARGVRGIIFDDVKITTTGCGYSQAPNTDGFNIQGEDMIVKNSQVRNGDDCVPIFPPSRNVFVNNMTCECGNPPVVIIWPAENFAPPGYAGDTDNVTFNNIFLKHTSSGVAIKSLTPFTGKATNIQFTNINMSKVKLGMAINFFAQGSGYRPLPPFIGGREEKDRAREERLLISQRFPVDVGSGLGSGLGSSVTSLRIENVTGTADNPGHINCLDNQPCKDIRFVNVNLKLSENSDGKYTCMNTFGTYENCHPVPCF